MAEWSNAAVLKTVEGHTSGGSNPSSSAKKPATFVAGFLLDIEIMLYYELSLVKSIIKTPLTKLVKGFLRD